MLTGVNTKPSRSPSGQSTIGPQLPPDAPQMEPVFERPSALTYGVSSLSFTSVRYACASESVFAVYIQSIQAMKIACCFHSVGQVGCVSKYSWL